MAAERRASASARLLPVVVAAITLASAGGVYGLAGLAGLRWEAVGYVGLLAYTFALVLVYAWYRRRREEEDREAQREAVSKNLHLPATLYPVIDPDLCIGSLSCLKACPEGDILGVVNGRAALINAAACIGHGKCFLECPVDAIKLVFGTSVRGVDLPEVNEFFESARPGVHIIGELGGMGLIKNAMAQGLQLAEFLAQDRAASPAGAVDLAIVGAGPAGIAAALGCKSRGVSFRLLEQESLGGTVFSYPRQKVVMMEPVELPRFGRFGRRLLLKEELLEQFRKAVAKAGVQVEEGAKVTGIEGEDGAFRVLTSRGPLEARKVALAIGRRGTPRKLGAKGEQLPKVTYRLVDPEQYDGARVLVVGGGDSALEAAIQLVEQSDAEVALCYRNPEFGKAREANKRKAKEHAEAGRLKLLMSSQVTEVRPEEVSLKTPEGEQTLGNDFVIVCIGGELPTEFLSSLGITLRRHYATRPGDDPEASFRSLRRGGSKEESEREKRRRLAVALFALGALVTAMLAAAGWDYYALPKGERLASPLHQSLRPVGDWGHGVGIVATGFMLSNFLYVVRKRWRRLKGYGPLRNWLTFHQFVGFMSPIVICFHAAFQANNLLAASTAGALVVVVLTGTIGRWVFGLLSDQDERVREHAEVLARWERHRARLDLLLREVTEIAPVRALVARACAQSEQTLLGALLRRPFAALRTRRDLKRVRHLFLSGEHYRDFVNAYRRALDLQAHASVFNALKRFLRIWRLWHVAAAVFLVALIAAHIVVSVQLGFRWIL